MNRRNLLAGANGIESLPDAPDLDGCITADEEKELSRLLDKTSRLTLHGWVCSRLKGGSASLCFYAGESLALLRVMDAVRDEIQKATAP